MPMIDKLVIDFARPVDLPADVANDKEMLRDGLAALLYHQGRITPVQAREMMGVTRREFEDRLADFGYAVMDETDLAAEVAAADRRVPRSRCLRCFCAGNGTR